MTSPAPSPLLEATTDSLDELFNRDPLGYSAQDIETIVAKLRAGRNQFAKKDAEEGAKPKAAKPKANKAALLAAPVEITSLEDLGL